MAKNAELEAIIAATGKSYGEFATAAQISLGALNKYLAGTRRRVGVRELGTMAEAAGVPIATIRTAIADGCNRPSGSKSRSGASSEQQDEARRAKAMPEAEDVNRREFIITSTAAVAASNLLFHGFSEQLRNGPKTREQWEAIVDALGVEYMQIGAGVMRERIADHLSVIQAEPHEVWRWGISAKLMTLYAKTFPGSDSGRTLEWYHMAAVAADRSTDPETQIWVRGRAAIALGYEGAAAPVAYQFGLEATDISAASGIKSMGLLNAQMGGAHAATLLGDMKRADELYLAGRHTFDQVGSTAAISDFAVPWWRQGVYSSLLLARMGRSADALQAQSEARKALPQNLPRFATHLDLHTALLIGKAGDKEGAAAFAEKTLASLPAAKHSLTLRLLADEIKRL